MSNPSNQPSSSSSPSQAPYDATGGSADPLVLHILADLHTNHIAQDKDFREFLAGMSLPPEEQPAWAVHAHTVRRLHRKKQDAAAAAEGTTSAKAPAERSASPVKLEPSRNREMGFQHGDAKRRVVLRGRERGKKMQREDGRERVAVRAVLMNGWKREDAQDRVLVFPLGHWICVSIACCMMCNVWANE
ncbi:hypothetical protein ACMFMG_010698 [Clarireedia jacksonii]